MFRFDPIPIPRTDAPIVLDAEVIEFWIQEGNGKTVKAEISDEPGKSVWALVDLGRRLAKYCEVPPSLRASIAQDIERDARHLAASGP